MSLARLGGDSFEIAVGKAIVIVPVLALIFLVCFSAYYYRDFLLTLLWESLPESNENKSVSFGGQDVPDNSLDMLRRIKELTGVLDAARTEIARLNESWRDMFGPASEEEVKETLGNMYSELESLRIAGSKEKLDELREENLTKALAAQELAERVRESSSTAAEALAQNEELVGRLNQTTLRLDLLEAEKAQLTSRLEKQTWCEVDWQEFMKTVNFGSNLLSENSRWSTRIMQRVNAEGLVIFGDPSVSRLAAGHDLIELSGKDLGAPPKPTEPTELTELTEQ